MQRLNLDWEKGKEYIRKLDQDMENWAHFLHGVTLTSPEHFDMVLNLKNMSTQSASAFLCSMVQSPEFQPTPASLAALKNQWLAAQARDRLMRDERTGWADLNVTAQNGRITTTYMPGQSHVAREIPAVLSGLEGADDLVCTMATTNILWVAETFDLLRSPVWANHGCGQAMGSSAGTHAVHSSFGRNGRRRQVPRRRSSLMPVA